MEGLLYSASGNRDVGNLYVLCVMNKEQWHSSGLCHSSMFDYFKSRSKHLVASLL